RPIPLGDLVTPGEKPQDALLHCALDRLYVSPAFVNDDPADARVIPRAQKAARGQGLGAAADRDDPYDLQHQAGLVNGGYDNKEPQRKVDADLIELGNAQGYNVKGRVVRVGPRC